MNAVLASLPASGPRPCVVCRMAGDGFVLLEFGTISFDLALNLLVHAFARTLSADPPRGVTELAPGTRSLLVGFDASVTTPHELSSALIGMHAALPQQSTATTGRHITLPLSFDDSTTKEAVTRHRSIVAPEDADPRSDIERIAAASGLSRTSEVLDAVTETPWYVAFIGYYPGLPFLLPMGGPPRLQVPKLDQRRAWTAEGAVSLGGSCVAIFPVEASGAYRVFGRTVPIYALTPVNDAFGGDQILLRPGDVVSFTGVEEAHLSELRRSVFENRYTYDIDDEPVVVDITDAGA